MGGDDPILERLASLEASFNANMEWLMKTIDDLQKRIKRLEDRLWGLLVAVALTLITVIVQLLLP